jgi:hypothetical protein
MRFILLVKLVLTVMSLQLIVLTVVSLKLLSTDVFPSGKSEMHCSQMARSRVLLQSTCKVDMLRGTLLTPCKDWRCLAIKMEWYFLTVTHFLHISKRARPGNESSSSCPDAVASQVVSEGKLNQPTKRSVNQRSAYRRDFLQKLRFPQLLKHSPHYVGPRSPLTCSTLVPILRSIPNTPPILCLEDMF